MAKKKTEGGIDVVKYEGEVLEMYIIRMIVAIHNVQNVLNLQLYPDILTIPGNDMPDIALQTATQLFTNYLSQPDHTCEALHAIYTAHVPGGGMFQSPAGEPINENIPFDDLPDPVQVKYAVIHAMIHSLFENMIFENEVQVVEETLDEQFNEQPILH